MAKKVKISEKQFQARVVAFARLNGWLVYHTYDSRRSAPGFPDLIMLRKGRMIVAELKAEKGRMSATQKEWIDAFADASDCIADNCHPDTPTIMDVNVWKPEHWPHIEALLRRPM